MDCALDYGDVRQNEMGRAVTSSGKPRSEFFITTKVPCCPTGPFCQDNPKHEACIPFLPMSHCDTSRNTTADVEHDLNIIGVEYVDLMLLHFPCNRWEDTVRTWRALEGAALSGKTRAIGISNFNQTNIEKLMTVAKIPPAVNQAGFAIGSPQNVTIGRDWGTINKCRELGITYEAYGSFGEPHSTVPTSKVDVLNHPTVKRVAARNNQSTALVAYRWTVQHGMVVLASSGNPVHMRKDLSIFDFELSAEDMAELDAVGMDSSFISV
jgi:diketogulonate reductase-like aldo/keto reductase